jgi:hypothetical protein
MHDSGQSMITLTIELADVDVIQSIKAVTWPNVDRF